MHRVCSSSMLPNGSCKASFAKVACWKKLMRSRIEDLQMKVVRCELDLPCRGVTSRGTPHACMCPHDAISLTHDSLEETQVALACQPVASRAPTQASYACIVRGRENRRSAMCDVAPR